LGPENFKNKNTYYTGFLFFFFNVEATFGPLENRIKAIDINQDEIFQNSWVDPFLTTEVMKKFWKS
jgi:hypothetical protein